MNLGFEITTDMKALAKEVSEKLDAAMIKAMSEVLHDAIEKVRVKMLDKAYEDHTGNLNSSTGFLIYKDGRVVHQDFRLSNQGTDKQTGLKAGLETALSVLRETQGWGIVLASGMEYASWVESKGYAVLRGPASELEKILVDAVNKIGTIQ